MFHVKHICNLLQYIEIKAAMARSGAMPISAPDRGQ
jgi:hypothetical protein